MSGGGGDETAGPVEAEAPRLGLGALFSRLIDEAGTFVRAEVRLYRAQAAQKALSAGLIVALIGGAVMLLQALLVALLVGMIMVLAPHVGIAWAVVIVCVVTAILIAICLLFARSRVSAMLKPEDIS